MSAAGGFSLDQASGIAVKCGCSQLDVGRSLWNSLALRAPRPLRLSMTRKGIRACWYAADQETKEETDSSLRVT
jgi:hypothetical protein